MVLTVLHVQALRVMARCQQWQGPLLICCSGWGGLQWRSLSSRSAFLLLSTPLLNRARTVLFPWHDLPCHRQRTTFLHCRLTGTQRGRRGDRVTATCSWKSTRAKVSEAHHYTVCKTGTRSTTVRWAQCQNAHKLTMTTVNVTMFTNLGVLITY